MITLFLRIKFWWAHRRCWKCGSADLRESMNWIRGYNNLCSQAAGCTGKRCQDCGFIHFKTPYTTYAKTVPHWVSPYPPSADQIAYDAQRKTGIDLYATFDKAKAAGDE